MATRLYLPASGTAPLGSLGVQADWEQTTGLARRPTSTTKSNTALADDTRTWASASTQQWVWWQFQSACMSAGYSWTTADTVSMVIRVLEGHAQCDDHLAYIVKVVSADGATVRGVVGLYHATSTEFVTTAATRIHNARTDGATNFTSYAGDRIIIELGLHGVTPSTSYTQTMRVGDPSATADFALTADLTTDLCPWVELSKTVAFGNALMAGATNSPPKATLAGDLKAKGKLYGATNTPPKATVSGTLTGVLPANDLIGNIPDAKATVSGTLHGHGSLEGAVNRTEYDTFDSYSTGSIGGQGTWLTPDKGSITVRDNSGDNTVHPGTAGLNVARNSLNFNDNQFAEIKIDAVGVSSPTWVGVTVRANSVGGYSVYYSTHVNDYGYFIRWFSDWGSYSQLGSLSTRALQAGDVIRLEAVGNIITVKINGVVDTSIGTNGKATDSTYTSGQVGIAGWNSGFTVLGDEWRGGAIVSIVSGTAKGKGSLVGSTNTPPKATVSGTLKGKASLKGMLVGELGLRVGLISHWKLDESSGQAIDSMGRYHSYYNDATQNQTGKLGTSYLYGSGLKTKIPDSPYWTTNNTTSVTVSAWVNIPSNGPTYSAIFAQYPTTNGPCFALHRISANNYKMNFFDGSTLEGDTFTMNYGTWYHLVWIKTNGSLTFYVDGVSKGTVAPFRTVDPPEMWIGNDEGAEYMLGRIDELSYWYRAITLAELSRLNNSGGGLTFEEYYVSVEGVLKAKGSLAGSTNTPPTAMVSGTLKGKGSLAGSTNTPPTAIVSGTLQEGATTSEIFGNVSDSHADVSGTLKGKGALKSYNVGAELVANNAFDADTDWLKTSVTIADGVCHFVDVDGPAGPHQPVLTIGHFYQYTWEVKNWVHGSVLFTDGYSSTGGSKSADGVYSGYFRSRGIHVWPMAVTNTHLDVDNVYVQERTDFPQGVAIASGTLTAKGSLNQKVNMVHNGVFADASLWVTGAGWSISDGVANFDDVNSGTSLGQLDADLEYPMQDLTQYILEFDIGIVSGSALIYVTSAAGNRAYIDHDNYVDGHHKVGFRTVDVSAGGIAFYGYTGSSNPFTLDNVELYLANLVGKATVSGTLKGKGALANITLDVEKVNNGTFDSETGWTYMNGYLSISGGTLNYDNTGTSYARQTLGVGVTADNFYRISFDVLVNNGRLLVGDNLGENFEVLDVETRAVGSYVYIGRAIRTTTWCYIWAYTTSTFSLDNLSIKAITVLNGAGVATVSGTLKGKAILVGSVDALTRRYGLRAFYKLDEAAATGTASDAHRGRTLTVSGDVTQGEGGKLSNSAKFNGNSDLLQMNQSWKISPGSEELTLMLWVKFNVLASTRAVASYITRCNYYAPYPGGIAYSAFHLYQSTSDRLVFDTQGPQITVQSSVLGNTGQWYHVVCVAKNGQDHKLYVDGVDVSYSPSTLNHRIHRAYSTYLTASNLFYLGYAGTTCHEVNIDEYAVFTRAFTQDDVDFFWNSGDGRTYEDIKGEFVSGLLKGKGNLAGSTDGDATVVSGTLTAKGKLYGTIDGDSAASATAQLPSGGIAGHTDGVAEVSGTLKGKGELISLLLGSELVVNQGFETDTWWSKDTGWTINGGVATFSNVSASVMYGSVTLPLNTPVRWKYHLIRFVAGGCQTKYTTGTNTKSAVGIYVIRDRTGTLADRVGLQGTAGAEFDVANASVKEVTGRHCTGVASVSGTLKGRARLAGIIMEYKETITPFTDNFDSYTVGDLDNQGNWRRVGGVINVFDSAGDKRIRGGQSANCLYAYDGTYSNNQYAKLTLENTPATSVWLGVSVRCQADDSTNGFQFVVDNSTTWNNWSIQKVVSGADTELLGGEIDIVSGDVLKLYVWGNKLRAFINNRFLGEIEDSTYTSGRAGVTAYGTGTSQHGDNWEGGDLVSICIVSGTSKGKGKLYGATDGDSTVSGALKGKANLAGHSDGVASVSGTLYNATLEEALSGATDGVASVSGTLVAKGKLYGTIVGVTSVSGICVLPSGQIVGRTDGDSVVLATLGAKGKLYGVTDGVTSVTGVLVAKGKLISATNGVAVVTAHFPGFKTEWNLTVDTEAGRTVTLPLVQTRIEGALNYDCYVDWGDGSPLSYVTSYNDADRIHIYSTTGTKTIEIVGVCEGWSFNNAGDRTKITKILSWGTSGFKYLKSGFYGCTNLSELPTGGILASGTGILTDGFYAIFRGCTGLTSLPTDLFRYHTAVTTNAFGYAFYGCSNLVSLPTDLFRYNTAATTGAFAYTFRGCIKLASLPTDLFRYNTAVSSSGAFSGTFWDCIALTSLPTDLFRYNTAVTSSGFTDTFNGCTGLTSLPTDLFRYNTLVSSSGFYGTFNGCSNLVSLPTDLFRYNTAVTSSGFRNVFASCTKLASLPTDLFRYNTLVSTYGFNNAFSSCSALASVPIYLFRYNTAVSTSGFDSTFENCYKLRLNANIFYAEGEQSTRFLNKVSSFVSCFSRTAFSGVKGTAPDLWNCNFGTETPTKTSCFAGAGNSCTSISNNGLIPSEWGGTGGTCAVLQMFTSTAGSSSISGTLIPKSYVEAIVSGISVVSGILQAKGKLYGTIAGVTQVSGICVLPSVQIAGVTYGDANVSGTLKGKAKLTTSVNGVALLGGVLGAEGDLLGSIISYAQLTGTLIGVGKLLGNTDGVAFLTGRISYPGMAIGSIAGIASLAGRMIGHGLEAEIIEGTSLITKVLDQNSLIKASIDEDSTITLSIDQNSLIL